MVTECGSMMLCPKKSTDNHPLKGSERRAHGAGCFGGGRGEGISERQRQMASRKGKRGGEGCRVLRGLLLAIAGGETEDGRMEEGRVADGRERHAESHHPTITMTAFPLLYSYSGSYRGSQ